MDSNSIMTWATFVMAVAAVLSAIVAISAVIAESKRARLSLSFDLLERLDRKFESGSMLRLRRNVALGLLKNSFKDVGDLLDFFETLGIMTNHGAIDKRMVWNEFFYWVHRTMQLSDSYVKDARKSDPTIWEDVVKLYDELKKIEITLTLHWI